MTKDNIELKAQNQTLQTKMQQNQKYENLKILCKATEELQNLNQATKSATKRNQLVGLISDRLYSSFNPISTLVF